MSDLLWELKHVTLAGNRRPRLDAVSLEIRAGVTAVVGYSGAGKTSLLNLLAGFENPDSGHVISHVPKNNGRLGLFWVPQSYGLWPHLGVAGHLSTVLPAAGTDEEILALLDDFDLADKSDVSPERLSEGERARLTVSRALASNAAVLVMDEPLVHVDPARIGKYWEAVRRHCAEKSVSLVLATHSPETVLSEATHTICLKQGQVRYVGDVDELYHRPASAELAEFLGPGNWLTPDEAEHWLKIRPQTEQCFRPEQVKICPSDDGGFVVQSSRFAGSLAEVELLDPEEGCTRKFVHRPAANTCKKGDRVLLKAVLSLLICVLFLGCEAASGPVIPLQTVNYRSMPPDGPRIPAPRGMTVDENNNLYVLDNAGRVLVYDETGKLTRQWSMPDSEVGKPEGVCVLKDGRVAVADTHYSQIVFFNSRGEVSSVLGSHGEEPGEFQYPVAITQDAQENLYVCEYGNNDRVQKFSVDGKFLLEFGSFGIEPGEFQRPSGIVWLSEKVYVADAINNRIQVFSDTGEFLEIIGKTAPSGGLYYPYDIAKGADGHLYVVEYGAGRVSKMSVQGNMLGRYGSTGPGDDQFSQPWGLTVDSKSRIFVADTGNRRIVELVQ